MRILGLFLAALALLAGVFVALRFRSAPKPQASSSGRYRAGQRWSFRGRPQDPAPSLVVGKVETTPEGVVVHVSVFGIHVVNPHSPQGVNTEAPHLPLSAEALDASGVELMGTGRVDDAFERGYSEWAKAKGGVFAIPVAECLDILEQALRGAPQT